MFVRIVYATGDPGKIDQAAEGLNTEGRRLLADQPGYRGFGLFVDRDLGKLLVSTWWETEEAREGSNDRLRQRRAEILEPFAATVAVDNYEAVVLHTAQQPGTGAAMRMTRVEFDPSDAELFADTFGSTVLPKLETLPGLARATLMLDKARGRGLVGAIFTDRKALAASRAGQASARHEGTAKAHVTVIGLEEFDVVASEVRGD
jgi:heme-degrading monooxygenase HmoA